MKEKHNFLFVLYSGRAGSREAVQWEVRLWLNSGANKATLGLSAVGSLVRENTLPEGRGRLSLVPRYCLLQMSGAKVELAMGVERQKLGLSLPQKLLRDAPILKHFWCLG